MSFPGICLKYQRIGIRYSVVMIKRKLVRRGCPAVTLLFILTFVFCLFAGAWSMPGQKIEIILHDERLQFTPGEFFIANVIDKRDNRDAVAWILPRAESSNKEMEPLPVDFAGGGLNAIKKFIDHNIPKNASLRPVDISLKTFRAVETAIPNGWVEGHVTLVLSFELETDSGETQHLAGYTGSTVYTRKAGSAQEIEPVLRHTLENGLVYLNNWINKEANTNIYLAKSVKLTFADFAEKEEGDTIYYSANRPLTWADFQSDVPDSKYDANVFPSIGYTEQVTVINGVVSICIRLKVFLPKSACWAKVGSRSDYTLNHEQRHFDIAKIAAEQFKHKLKTENLPVNNYDGFINVDYLDAYREMNTVQKQYDDETRHGSSQYEQQRWNERIDGLLKSYRMK